jgi:hypothetical protein
MNYAAAKSRFSTSPNTHWQPRPLNRKGDLSGWKQRMKQACPSPVVGQVVYLKREYFDNANREYVYERVGYKVLKLLSNGEAIWQRGQVVSIDEEEYQSSNYFHA